VGLRCEGRILGPSLSTGGNDESTGWDKRDGRRGSNTDYWDKFDDSTRVHRCVNFADISASTDRLLELQGENIECRELTMFEVVKLGRRVRKFGIRIRFGKAEETNTLGG